MKTFKGGGRTLEQVLSDLSISKNAFDRSRKALNIAKQAVADLSAAIDSDYRDLHNEGLTQSEYDAIELSLRRDGFYKLIEVIDKTLRHEEKD